MWARSPGLCLRLCLDVVPKRLPVLWPVPVSVSPVTQLATIAVRDSVACHALVVPSFACQSLPVFTHPIEKDLLDFQHPESSCIWESA